MAGAGLGDVLAGLVARCWPKAWAFDAACLAVWLHANAGEQQGVRPWAGGQ
jgi:NAD(P)H-hydrate epimerase